MTDFEPIELGVDPGERDYREAYMTVVPRVRTAILLGIAFVALGALAALNGGGTFVAGGVAGICFAMGVYWSLMWYRVSYQLPANYKRLNAQLAPVRYRFMPEALEMMTRVSTSSTRWEVFSKFYETPRLFIISWPNLSFHIIPKRNIPSERLSDLRSLLNDSVARR